MNATGWRRSFAPSRRTWAGGASRSASARPAWTTRTSCARCATSTFAGAEKIVLVQDNLSTHSPASLYEAFTPREAARIRARFEFHFTPKHGSWLNIAEIELSAPARGCLARRIPGRATLARELHALAREHNLTTRSIRWQFTTSAARTKLRKLYPSFGD